MIPMIDQFLLLVIGCLLATNGFFMKRVLDDVHSIKDDVDDMKPKVELLWEDLRKP